MTPFENISAAFGQGSWHAAALLLRAAYPAPFGAGFAVTNSTRAHSTAERPVLLTHPMPHCISMTAPAMIVLSRRVRTGELDVPHLLVKEGAA